MYKLGRQNIVADAFLRQYNDIDFLTSLHIINCNLHNELHKALPEDLVTSSLLDNLQLDSSNRLSTRDDILYDQDHIYVPAIGDLRTLLLREFYNTPLRGHVGVPKTYSRLTKNFNWPLMRKDVQELVYGSMYHMPTSQTTNRTP
ncbi:uncharacterized protein LOC113866865 [Abrus precatorius]|uniref:Uncharacterized protein LOC113866865 n=1 Tax=Abrus precatorius TaxID=3816 RepID=A0A8B8LRG5_ABRPR|nr:uncharacterized protein LOC113866865 [Abrus precatorius]